jgi:hypothetical protein
LGRHPHRPLLGVPPSFAIGVADHVVRGIDRVDPYLRVRVLNALDGIDERSVRTHVPHDSVLKFHHQAEHLPCGVVHNPRGRIAIANVIGHQPQSNRERALRIGRDAEFSGVRPVRFKLNAKMLSEQRQLSLYPIREFRHNLGDSPICWTFFGCHKCGRGRWPAHQ